MKTYTTVSESVIRAELVRAIYRQTPTTASGFTILSTVLVAVLWQTTPHGTLMGWLAAVYGVVVVRILLARSFQRCAPAVERTEHWGRWLALTTLAFGILWGLTAVLFLNTDEPINLIAITIMLMGINASAIVGASAYLLALAAYTVPAMGTLIVVLLLRGDALHTYVAVLAIVATLSNSSHAVTIHRVLGPSARGRRQRLPTAAQAGAGGQTAQCPTVFTFPWVTRMRASSARCSLCIGWTAGIPGLPVP